MERRKIYQYIGALGILLSCLCSSCIKNDIPYAKVPLSITEFKVSGQKGEAVISDKNQTVNLTLADTVNPKKITISELQYTEKAKATAQVGEKIDLSREFTIILSLYQEYPWKIIASQPIERRIQVVGQVGNATFQEEEQMVLVYVTKDTSLKNLEVKDLKLGPARSALNGQAEGVPEVEWKIYSNYAEAEVRVTFKDFIDQTWRIRVYQSASEVTTVKAYGWVNVGWMYGSATAGTDCGFEYREQGTEEWTVVAKELITVDGGNFSAKVPHLKANTAYECRAYSNDRKAEALRFSTVEPGILPNMGFEEWHKQGKVICPWLKDGERCWDTGNHGSNTLSENNLTQGTEDIRPGGSPGSLAAQLTSKSIVGVFAAGNLFVGEYKATKGMNGVLGLGHEFNSYPTRLKGWYKYQTKNITHTEKGFEYMKNQPDTCIVWVALGDWELTTSESGFKSAVEVRTSKGKPENGKYFDKNDPHLIAYGEMTSGKSTEAYTPFQIDLKYRATDRRPTALLIVCSASKYGDYFTGAVGATLWVDDFSLEYDEEK